MRSALSRGNRASPMKRSLIHPGLRAGPDSTISASIWNCSAAVLAVISRTSIFRVIALKCREARNEPAHRKGRQRRDAQRLLKTPLAHPFDRGCQPVERRAGFIQQRSAGFGRDRVAAGAHEQLHAKPFLQCPDLAAHSAMRDTELDRCTPEAAVACCGLYGLYCVEGLQPSYRQYVRFA